jgi:acetyltransferase-like isoleucine patch superfamily enzyme
VRVLQRSDRAPGLLLGEGVELPDDVELGANVVIHAGVQLGRGVRIQDAAIVAKALVLSRQSKAEMREPDPTVVGDEATIAAQAVVVAGASIGAGAFIGDQSHVRERARIGRDSAVGRGSAIDNDVQIGDRVRIQTGCYITAFSTVEDDVFIGPGVFTYNDNAMGRHQKRIALTGAIMRRACRVGGGARILPGIEIGDEAVVATGAVVTREVAPRTLVMGVPARYVRDLGDEELIENWR